jgi:hypothetical protein
MRNHAVSFITFSSDISPTLRKEMLGFSGFNCYMCGLAPGEIDFTTGERAHLHVAHMIERNVGGRDDFSNLQAACSICIDGRKRIRKAMPSAIWLLSQVRRAGQEEQRTVLNWLRKKFKE